MIGFAFAAVTLGSVLMATFVGDMRRAILALWIAGLGIGGLYLTIGAELLAIVQWIISTLLTISFVFFSVMFGESKTVDKDSTRKRLVITALSVALGTGFAAIIWFGSAHLWESGLDFTKSGNDLASLGKAITQDHLLSLEVLALTLFLVLVGGGVIARPEKVERES